MVWTNYGLRVRLFAQNVLLADGFVPAVLGVEGGRIVEVLEQPSPTEIADARNLGPGYLIPGLIDSQLNGYFGVDFSTGSDKQIRQALTELPKTGTTAVCPTIITSPLAQLANQVRLLSRISADIPGARNLGVHLEGPFISSEKRGAHDPELLVGAREVGSLLELLPLIRILTLAPELEGARDLVQAARNSNSIISMGHTMATAAQLHEFVEIGAQLVTHLFNGQRQIHQREPGISIAALVNQDVHFGIIVDGEHVHYDLVKLAQQIASERMIVVSDASAALGAMPSHSLSLGGQELEVDSKGAARRLDGTLASSGLTQLQAIENAVSHGLDREKLIRSATAIPARLLGETEIGLIETGYLADLVYYESGANPVVKEVLVAGVSCLSS